MKGGDTCLYKGKRIKILAITDEPYETHDKYVLIEFLEDEVGKEIWVSLSELEQC